MADRGQQSVIIIRWCARLWAAFLFIFWGAFFVEHLEEWFIRAVEWPPRAVVALQGLHFLFLLGLVVGWWWEFIGGLVVLFAAVAFFSLAAGSHAAAFTLISIAPAIVWIGSAVYAYRRRATLGLAGGTAC
jgi:hypothetical protein